MPHRFDHTLNAYQGLAIIPSRLLYLKSCEEKGDKRKVTCKEQFKTFVNYYWNDFPNPSAI